MENFQDYLNYTIYQDLNVRKLLVATAIFLGILIFFKIFKSILLKKFKKLSQTTNTKLDDAIIESLENLPMYFFLILGLYIAVLYLNIDETVNDVARIIFVIVAVYQAIHFFQVIIEEFLRYLLVRARQEEELEGENPVTEKKELSGGEKQAENKQLDQTTFHGLRFLIRLILWSIGVLLILSNLGVDISTLVASLGVGGVAVALAAQTVLGDIFSSFSIYFDRPFEIGDFIVVGPNEGIVKKIGMKSTRFETLGGEELVMANQELTKARIQNYKRMRKRRIVTVIGIVYETSLEKIKKAKTLIREAIEGRDGVEFERVHFTEFADSSLNFEFVYYILSKEYGEYLDKQEQINLQLMKSFNESGIEFAYPTRKIFLAGGGGE